MVSGIGLFGSGADNEVYSFGEEVFEICKKYMYLRETLKPYIKEQMRITPVSYTHLLYYSILVSKGKRGEKNGHQYFNCR